MHSSRSGAASAHSRSRAAASRRGAQPAGPGPTASAGTGALRVAVMSTLSVLAAPEAWCLVSLQHTGPDSNFSPKNRNLKQPLGGVWDPAGSLPTPCQGCVLLVVPWGSLPASQCPSEAGCSSPESSHGGLLAVLFTCNKLPKEL